ncbi:segregation and condensation protein A [Bacteroidota bacterium]
MYQVRLTDFEGPLDLLLFFIQRDELDVYDIPIARIADEFLEHVRLMDVIDLDGAGEFIYMAALLINIKARMLLPRTSSTGDDEIVDPRKELVERLVEYVRFRDAADRLGSAWERRSQLYAREEPVGTEELDHTEVEVEYDVSVFHLIAALKRVLDATVDSDAHLVGATDYSVEQQRDWLRNNIVAGNPVSFADLVTDRPKLFIIATFLAILEVVREGALILMMGPSAEDFYLARREPDTTEEP